MEGAVVFLVLFMVSGIVSSLFIYYRSKERQMMIERGMAAEEILALYRKPSAKGNWLLKLGIIAIIFGVFLGFAIHVGISWNYEEIIAPIIIVGAGIGFIAAHKLGEKVDKEES